MTREIKVFSNLDVLFAAAAEQFTRAAASSKGPFRVALSGGNTPRSLFSLLADEKAPYRAKIPWGRIIFFWSDERCVPPDSSESNFKMANDALLSRVPVPREHIHRIEGELPDAAQAANSYQETIRSEFGAPPSFDFVFLGMGPDGHTASLFPGTEAVDEKAKLVTSVYVEAKKAYRVTFTLPLLNASKYILFLVSGPDKAATAQEVLEQAPSATHPASLVSPSHGKSVWFLDQPAARRLKS